MIEGTCAACGMPGHRFGTTDTEHDYSATACINSLLGRVEELTAVVKQLAALLPEADA